MAKKSSSKRKPRTKMTPPAAPQESDVEVEPVVEARPSPTAREARGRAETGRLEDEYAYITGDLRRVFILAGVMFALLIVLNLVLNL
jgi:hypothetical protein